MTAPADRYECSAEVRDEELLTVCRVYARAVVARHDLTAAVDSLDWRVSRRAKRRAGAVYHLDGVPVRVVVARRFFDANGWTGLAETIRHELIHVHLLNERGDPGHGDAFREWADRLETGVRCERFAEPNWIVECENCGGRLHRYRRSKLVKWPGKFRCGECGGDLRAWAATDATDASERDGRSADG